jgi:4-amino-4-deoxy-L-arabinose transferase-like glycosyltransferase
MKADSDYLTRLLKKASATLSFFFHRRLIHIAMLPLFFIVLMVLLPDFSLREINPDEGTHLIIAQLYHQGYAFISEINHNHLPLFNVMLAGWFNLFGDQLETGRTMVTLFAALLLWCLFELIQQQSGRIAAFTAVLLLLLSTVFLITAASIMQALPFIALGLASLLVIRQTSSLHSGSVAVYVSALLMAMAMMVKLFAVLMIPGLLMDLARRPGGGRLILFWMIALMLLLLLFTWLTAPALFDFALLEKNFRILFLYRIQDQQIKPDSTLLQLLQWNILDLPILVMAAIVVVRMFSKVSTASQSNPEVDVPVDPFPVAWLICGVVLLLLLHPVWTHYYLMLLVPLVWLAALSIGDCVKRKILSTTRLLSLDGWLLQVTLAMILVLILFLPLRIAHINSYFVKGGAGLDSQLLATLGPYGGSTCRMVTDRPMYAFMADCTVPPEHSVTGSLWLESGVHSEETYLRAIDLHHPQLVLLARFIRLKKNLDAKLKQRGYKRIYNSENAWLYARDIE